jgi:cysteinyl-tRNA synthetase
MSTKYLGDTFDIHGGGMDLLFPHHECEIAQNVAGYGREAVKYWMHNNMITINGQKMGRSLGNFITLDELFSGEHKALVKAYDPMTIRFFILQAHYRSTLDFSNEALQSSEKGLQRLLAAVALLDKLEHSKEGGVRARDLREKCEAAMNDDLNTPILIAHLFDGAKMINSIYDGKLSIDEANLEELRSLYDSFVFVVLGLRTPEEEESSNELTSELIESILKIRQSAKERKDWNTADEVRNALQDLGITIKDRKDGADWEIN